MNTHVRGDTALRAALMRGIRSHSLSNSAFLLLRAPSNISEFVRVRSRILQASLFAENRAVNAALDRVDRGRASAIGEMERLQKQADTQERTVPNVEKKRNEEER